MNDRFGGILVEDEPKSDRFGGVLIPGEEEIQEKKEPVLSQDRIAEEQASIQAGIDEWQKRRSTLNPFKAGFWEAPKEQFDMLVHGITRPITSVVDFLENAASVVAGKKLVIADPNLRSALRGESQVIPHAISANEGAPSQIATGTANAVIDFANYFLTPDGLSTLGLSALPSAAQKTVALSFAADMAVHAPQQLIEGANAAARGDLQEGAQKIVSGVGQTLLSAKIASHATTKPVVEQVAAGVGPATADAVKETLSEKPVSPELPNVTPEIEPAAPSGGRTSAPPEVAVATPEKVPAEAKAEVASVESGVPDEIIGMGGAVPSEFSPSRQTATGIKNAQVDAERQARGQEPIMGPQRQSNQETWDKAMAKIDTDPAWQDRLIEELESKPRTPSAEEIIALDHRYVDLQNEYAKATRDGAKAYEEGRLDDVADAKNIAAFFEQKLTDLEDVARKVGTEWGRSGQMRQRLLKEDFSLAAMESKMRAAKGFEPLTESEHAEVIDLNEKLAAQIADLEKKLAAGDILPKAKRPEAQLTPEVARAKGKLQSLRDEFNAKLEKLRYQQKPPIEKAWANLKSFSDLRRALMTSYDVSAVFRQGGITVSGNWWRGVKNLKPMFQAMANKELAGEIDQQIKARPNYPLYERSGLYIAPLEGKLHGREEAFASKFGEKIPGVGASQRAYVTFLNKLRADTFDSMRQNLIEGTWEQRLAGIKPKEATEQAEKAIADYINISTGRGKLGETGQKAAETLSVLFFSPRLVTSRFQFLAGEPLWRGSIQSRYLVAREYAKMLSGLAIFYALGAMSGGSVETDPRASDFGKIRFGKTRVDPLAGLSQVAVLEERVRQGEKKTALGKVRPIRGKVPYGEDTGASILGTFVRTKLAPDAALAVDIAAGKNVVGEKVTAQSVLFGAGPISFQDIAKLMEDQGVERGTVLQMLNLFGMGVQTYDAPRSN